MRYKMLMAFSILPVALWAQGIKYSVEGKMIGMKDGSKVYLYTSTEEGSRRDSAVITGGYFVFRGRVKEPLRASLYSMSSGSYDYIPVLLERGKVFVSGEGQLAKARVRGTLVNEQMDDLRQHLRSVTDKKDELVKEFYEKDSATQVSETYIAEYKEKYAIADREEKAILAKYIKDHPKSIVSIDALQMYGGFDAEAADVEPLFQILSPGVKSTKAGKAYGEEIQRLKKIALHSIAPQFAQDDTSGKRVSLSDFRGKYVLIDFWASWCGPCRAENPNVVKAYSRYAEKNFTVLGVSLDDERTRSAWIKAIADDHLPWTQVSDLKGWKNEAAVLYSVKGIPQNFLLAPDGTIIAKNLRGAALERKLEELLQ